MCMQETKLYTNLYNETLLHNGISIFKNTKFKKKLKRPAVKESSKFHLQ